MNNAKKLQYLKHLETHKLYNENNREKIKEYKKKYSEINKKKFVSIKRFTVKITKIK